MATSMAAIMAAEMRESLGNVKRELISAHLGRGEKLPQASDLQRPTEELVNDETVAAWKDLASFSKDSVISQLSDRFNGLGHRASKARKDRERMTAEHEQLVNRFGEEKAQYILECKERQQSSSHHRSATGISAQSSTPRFAGRVTPSYMPSPEPNRQRALSPSRHGKIKFGPNGQRFMVNGSTSFAAAPTTPRLTQILAVEHSRTQSAQVNNVSEKRIDPRSVQSTPVAKPVVRETDFVRPLAITEVKPLTPEKVTTMTAPQLRAKAMWHALNPGKGSDDWMKHDPGLCAKLLQGARENLISNAMKAAQSPDSMVVRGWREQNKDREWTVVAGIIAKDMVENRTEKQIDEYYNAHPEHRDFLEAARKCFEPQPKREPETDRVMIENDTVAAPQQKVKPLVQAPVVKDMVAASSHHVTTNMNGTSGTTIASTDQTITGAGDVFQNFFTDLKEASTAMLEILIKDIRAPIEELGHPIELVLTARNVASGQELSSQCRTVALKMMSSSLGYTGSHAKPAINKLDGVVQTEDGLWEEDD